jgi:hypothetical protein
VSGWLFSWSSVFATSRSPVFASSFLALDVLSIGIALTCRSLRHGVVQPGRGVSDRCRLWCSSYVFASMGRDLCIPKGSHLLRRPQSEP